MIFGQSNKCAGYSLKQDMRNTETMRQSPLKKFIARPFNLGGDVNADRDIIYSERGV
jgi:hypothetical protein